MFALDFINTVAFGGVVLFAGHGVRRALPWLARYNVPAPVVGGLVVAVVVLIARSRGVELATFDTRLQVPLMIAFFTTVGFGASVSLLKVGGPQVVFFFALSTVLAVLQNVVGVALAQPLGMHPLFGVLNGSVTLTGGPATGLAFAPQFEQAGVSGAATIAVAAAMVGIVSGGLIGGPIGTLLIERHRLRQPLRGPRLGAPPLATHIVEHQLNDAAEPSAPAGEDKESYALLKGLVVILVAMWIGSWVGARFTAMGITLPAYIGAMLVAAAIRNVDDVAGVIGLSQRVIDDIGSVSLSLFLVLALMTLQLWQLAAVALPMLVILAAQVVLVAVACWPMFRLMGADYDAAVMSGGLCGFMLGTTANAMASMETIVDRYGPAPRAYLVVPMVGAFFIDFTNALLITVCLNIWS
ncbi:MAG: sodium/glutamate symporter [Acidobacteria bacterium RIFCSPLOWO2_02_FULL_65_29]|nr:MAG: sodium/glutamate symporter [Acidobacteria bacterium RIFCSPLOWO2_02_FULL_65_29]